MFIDTQRCKFERKVRAKIIFDLLSTPIEKFSNSTIDDYWWIDDDHMLW